MKYQEIKKIKEDEDLFEINMSPGNLNKLASQIDARAGMEFEMIVPNVSNVDLEPEYERDEDADRRARSFDDVEEFFNDGDYNSSRDVRRLIGELQEAYMEWKMERTSDDWIDQGEDYIRDYIVNNDLFDRDEAMDTARESVKDAFPDVDPNSEEFQTLISIALDKREEQFAEDEFESQGRIYNDAFEEFSNEKNEEYDESDFLEEELSYMSDIERNYDIQWPYYIDINQNQSGEVDIDRVADEFSSAIGRPVNASSRYHGATREKGKYVVEPDGSLEPDDYDDSGLEFVSPPLPLEEMFSDLDKVKKWADEKGCYTNSSTGLHINVSVPEFSVDNLDYIKLALLMGDKYVLEQFDRLGNTYAKSAMDKIVDRIKQRPEDAEMLLVKMKEGLGKLATKVIHSGATEKYTSINTKTGYIEFRSPGGDWLSDKFFNQIKPTLSRFVVALDAAMDPEKYRDEYLKKLYKLLQPKSKEDTLSYFAKYAAGELPKAALKSFIKQAQLERKVAKDPTGGEQYWWRVGRPGYGASVEVVATNKADAIALGKKEYPEWEYARDMTATPIRPFSDQPIKTSSTGQTYFIYDTQGGYNTSSLQAGSQEDAIAQFNRRIQGQRDPDRYQLTNTSGQVLHSTSTGDNAAILNGRPSNPDGNWFLKNSDTDEIIYRFNAVNYQDAYIVLQQWKEANPGDENIVYGTNLDRSQSGRPNDPNGRYAVVPRSDPALYGRSGRRPEYLFRFNMGNPAEQAQGRYILQAWAARNNVVPANYMIVDTEQWDQPADTAQTDANPLRPTGPGPWEVANRQNNQVYYNPEFTNRGAAETEARTWLNQNGHNPADFEVRTRQGSRSDAAQSGIIDIEPDIEQNFVPGSTLDLQRQRQQAAQQSAAAGTFRGTWLILDPDGQEIHRFGGIGNVQSDANRVAMNWMRSNPGRMQAGVTVVPEMS